MPGVRFGPQPPHDPFPSENETALPGDQGVPDASPLRAAIAAYYWVRLARGEGDHDSGPVFPLGSVSE